MPSGKIWEDLAGRYLKSKNYTIVDRNWTCHWGELDIIAKIDDFLVFVEVRYRANTNYGKTYQSITQKKKNSLRRAINHYLLKHNAFDVCWRLDAVCLTKGFGKVTIEHFENVLQ